MMEANLVRRFISIFDTRVAFSTPVMKEAPSLQTHWNGQSWKNCLWHKSKFDCRTSNEFRCQEKDLKPYSFSGLYSMPPGGGFRNINYDDIQCWELLLKWAGPSGTARLGQPTTKPEQAPELHPLSKISLISKGAHGTHIRYLANKNRYYT